MSFIEHKRGFNGLSKTPEGASFGILGIIPLKQPKSQNFIV
jgi:hypothetical protein